VSALVANVASANLLLNAGFEAPDAGPAPAIDGSVDDWADFNTSGVTKEQSRPGSLGSQSLRLAPNGPMGTGDGIAQQVFPANPNEVYSLGAWVFTPTTDATAGGSGSGLSGTRVAQFRIQWLNENNTIINQSILDVLDEDSPRQQWSFARLDNVVLPNNENITQVRARLDVTNAGGTGGGVAYFDDAVFVQGSLPLGGDFDTNAVVAGADYLNWQNQLGTIYQPGHLTEWENYYGFGPDAISGAVDAVPEPTGVACFVLGSILFTVGSVRMRQRS
jgi:hypothetical protein